MLRFLFSYCRGTHMFCSVSTCISIFKSLSQMLKASNLYETIKHLHIPYFTLHWSFLLFLILIWNLLYSHMCNHTVLEFTIILNHFLLILMLLWVITCSFTISGTSLPTWVLCTVSNAHLKSVAVLLIHSPPWFGPQNSGVPAL